MLVAITATLSNATCKHSTFRVIGAVTQGATMNTSRTELVARHSILTLLSEHEVASVSMAETAVMLSDGDEYVDLEQLDRGVRLATGTSILLSNVISRRAVCETTWSRVLTQLEAYRAATAHFGVGRGTRRVELTG
jgi:hypothetical protein